jgi:WD40 repeat protein
MGTAPAFSPDGRWAAATGDDRILRVCDTRNGAVVAEFPASAAAVFSPDGHYLAAGDASPEGVRLPDGHYLPGVDISPPCVRIWETQTWTSIAELRAASGDIDRDSEDGYWPGIGFSPDSKTLAIAFGSRIALWDAATGRMSTALTVVGGETNCGSFSHDGLYLFEPVDDGALGVWNMASHQRISTFPRYSEPSMISPDGTRIGDYGSILSYPSLTPLAGAPVDNKLKMGVFGWLPDGKAFVTENGTALALNYHGPPAIQLFRLRHPDTLYGLLWLPQCWLVIFGALASLWLIGRDLRRWRSSPMVVG